MASALISNIQKCCVHDGPGLRTVVFLMGCPLRCKWCQNPENLETKQVVLFDAEKCARCGRCLPYCPHGCCKITEDGLEFARSACTSCGICAEHCYIDAKTVCGQRMTAEAVYAAVMRDEVFYRDSGGGVTLSGGEPTLHADFCMDLFCRLQEVGVHTALETCGFCSGKTMLDIAAQTNLFLYDFKAFSEDIHRQWTGQSNQLIKENLTLLHDAGKQIIIRVPLIPGVNDGAEFERMLQYLQSMKHLKKLHLLPFHQVGASKYTLSNVAYDMQEVPACSDDFAQEHAARAQAYGFDVNIGGWDATGN